MDAISEMFSRGFEELLGRASGPLNFRLVIMPLVVTVLAIRAGLRDAREGRPTFVWTILTRPGERVSLLRSAAKDVGRILVVALILDTGYQVFVLRAFYIGQALIVAVACAVVPYIVVRGPATWVASKFLRKRGAASAAAGDGTTQSGSGHGGR